MMELKFQMSKSLPTGRPCTSTVQGLPAIVKGMSNSKSPNSRYLNFGFNLKFEL
jgi:hypothetical protein